MGNGRDKATQQAQAQEAQGQQQQQQAARQQTAAYNALFPAYQSELAAPGYTDQEKAGMTSAALQSIAGAEGDAAQQVRSRAARTGNAAGLLPAEEAFARQKAQESSAATAGLQGQFANQRIQGRQNAMAGLGGLYGMGTGAQNVGTGLESQALSDQTRIATTPGFWQSMLQSGIGAAGQMGAAYLKGGCWIAEAIYGPGDLRTHYLRWWLNNEWGKQWPGTWVMAAYRRFGQRVARLVRRSRPLRWAFRQLFDWALVVSGYWG